MSLISFDPAVHIFIEKKVGSLRYKVATSKEELEQAFKLRHQVFFEELVGTHLENSIDLDKFDAQCDHLIIIDDKESRIVGTYRLNCSKFNHDFYSAQEFKMRALLDRPEIKLELGRACIHPEYRKGAVMLLLLKGIAEYMDKSKAQLLFGCASVMTNKPREAGLVYKYLKSKNQLSDEWDIVPTEKYELPGLYNEIKNFSDQLSNDEEKEAAELLPALCKAYLSFGCVMAGPPAYDAEFECIDFLTVLEVEKLDPVVWQKMVK